MAPVDLEGHGSLPSSGTSATTQTLLRPLHDYIVLLATRRQTPSRRRAPEDMSEVVHPTDSEGS